MSDHEQFLERPWLYVMVLMSTLVVSMYIRSSIFKLRHIPTVGGPSWPILSYIGSKRFFRHAQEMFREGYEKHYGRLFKIAMLDRWLVVVTGRDLIKELIQAPESVLSFELAITSLVEAEYVFGREVLENQFQLDLIRRDLTRSLGILFPDVYDEVTSAFDDYIPKTDEWTAIPALKTAMNVVVRASNRVFVGLPACRNQAYLDRCLSFTRDVIISRQLITMCPTPFLKRSVARYIGPLPKTVKHVCELLGPEIERRKELMRESGKEFPGKTNDMLQWMLDCVYGDTELSSTRQLVMRILVVNFAAIHTSSSTFTHALLTLAAQPKYMTALREEVESVVNSEGFTKASLSSMHKMDSFFRESSRMNTMGGMALMRYAVQPYTFSDGTHVPAGSYLATPPVPLHLDESTYDQAHEFDPFRFDVIKDTESTRRHFTSTDFDYLAFGHGKHACPGRFFAGNELKAMLAHVLLNYDIRAEVEGVRPPNFHIGQQTIPNTEAKVLFRKRQL